MVGSVKRRDVVVGSFLQIAVDGRSDERELKNLVRGFLEKGIMRVTP
jgi:hypothetical protein